MAPLFHMEALLPGSISPKINSILQSHVYPRLGRVFRALARFKSLLLEAALGKTRRGGAPWSSRSKHAISYHARSTTTVKRSSKIASFMKPHPSYWAGDSSLAQATTKELSYLYASHVCSFHHQPAGNVVVPAPQPAGLDGAGEYYCGYLRWLEEEMPDEVIVLEEEEDVDGAADDGGNNDLNEIDRLAEKFIARCHAKFLLEKQESYRRYQEMMARSV